MGVKLSFEDILKEGDRREKQDGVIPEIEFNMPDGEPPVIIPKPDAMTMLAFSSVPDSDSARKLQVMFGPNQSDFNRVIRAFRGKPPQALTAFVESVLDAWGKPGLTPEA